MSIRIILYADANVYVCNILKAITRIKSSVGCKNITIVPYTRLKKVPQGHLQYRKPKHWGQPIVNIS